MERLAPLVDVRQRRIRLGALLVQPLPRLVVHAPALRHAVVGSVEHQRFRQLAGNLHREGRAIAPDGDVGDDVHGALALRERRARARIERADDLADGGQVVDGQMVGAHEFRRAVFGEVVQPGAQHVANNVRIGKAVVDLQRKAFGQIARAHAARRQLLHELEQPLAVLYRAPCFGAERMHAAGKVPVVVDVLDEGVKQSAILFADARARQLHAHMAVQRFRLRALVAQTGQVEPAGIPSDRRRRARIEPFGSRFGIGRSVAVLVGQLLEREGAVIVVEIEQGVALHQVADVRVQARDRQRQHLEALDGRGSEMLLGPHRDVGARLHAHGLARIIRHATPLLRRASAASPRRLRDFTDERC